MCLSLQLTELVYVSCIIYIHVSLQDPELPFLVYDIGTDLCIKCLESQEVERLLCASRTKKCGAVVKAVRTHFDLIPNVYEGINDPCREKTCLRGFRHVRHKPGCMTTKDG